MLVVTNTSHIDHYVWGTEEIIWGYNPNHEYTVKILRPNKGKSGCLSLQKHSYKTETWYVTRGKLWVLYIRNWMVETKILNVGDFLNIPAGTLHRIMPLENDTEILETSTVDRFAADKHQKKDVHRYHCVHGRKVSKPQNDMEKELIEVCIKFTLEAIELVENNGVPPEHEYQYTILNH